jgi:regulator of sigma E protease
MAALAFWLGVPETPCAVSSLMPGGAAWRAGLQPGDRIIQINDRKADELPLRFRDLQEAVTLSSPDEGVRFLIARPGVEKPFWVTITPDAARAKVSLAPTIGAAGPLVPQLGEKKAAWPNTPAAKADAFQPNDQVVAIDGHSIEHYYQLLAQLSRNSDRTLEFTIERLDPSGKVMVQKNLKVPPRPKRWMGLVMRLGKISALQEDSPAAKAGVHVDDFIVGIDGQPSGDVNVMELPELLRSKAGKEVVLSVSRKDASGQDTTVDLKVVPRDAPWYEGDLIQPGSPLTIPALGVALKVLNIVQGTQPESPAADATVKLVKTNQPAPLDRLAPGDEIVSAELVPADEEKRETELGKFRELTIEFIDSAGNSVSNWPFFVAQMQEALPDTKIRLTLRGDRYVELTPTLSTTQFNPDRGFVFQPEEFTYQASNASQAFGMAAVETKRALLQVYSFLRLLGSRISVYALGGPGTIFNAAAGAADRGFSSLLLFLTMLSANLAVINFLPIPVLDGGHMVFLALEGIMRRPVSERVVLAFQYAGLIFILGLMLFVIGLDIKLIPRF